MGGLALFLLAAMLRVHPVTAATVSEAKSGLRPVVIWHGLGDSAFAGGLQSIADLIEQALPGIYVHLIALGKDEDSDRQASIFSDINDDLARVCEELQDESRLQGGFDAIGFSQGGLFLRAYAERCRKGPPIRQLITIGSPHAGISRFPTATCESSWFMRLICWYAHSDSAYSSQWQHRVVPLTYLRLLGREERYRRDSILLADINNEREEKDASYKEAMARLDKFVMIKFQEDTVVCPRESEWFGWVNATGLRDTDIYREDWIGLKGLDEAGKLVFETFDGDHMSFGADEFTDKVVLRYLGSPIEQYAAAAPVGGELFLPFSLWDAGETEYELSL